MVDHESEIYTTGEREADAIIATAYDKKRKRKGKEKEGEEPKRVKDTTEMLAFLELYNFVRSVETFTRFHAPVLKLMKVLDTDYVAALIHDVLKYDQRPFFVALLPSDKLAIILKNITLYDHSLDEPKEKRIASSSSVSSSPSVAPDLSIASGPSVASSPSVAPNPSIASGPSVEPNSSIAPSSSTENSSSTAFSSSVEPSSSTETSSSTAFSSSVEPSSSIAYSSSISVRSDFFTKFYSLEKKIRLLIWGHALPEEGRIVEVYDYDPGFKNFPEDPYFLCNDDFRQLFRLRMTCSEANAVVLKQYNKIPAIEFGIKSLYKDCVFLVCPKDTIYFIEQYGNKTSLNVDHLSTLSQYLGRIENIAFPADIFLSSLQDGCNPNEHHVFRYLPSLPNLKKVRLATHNYGLERQWYFYRPYRGSQVLLHPPESFDDPEKYWLIPEIRKLWEAMLARYGYLSSLALVELEFVGDYREEPTLFWPELERVWSQDAYMEKIADWLEELLL